MLNLRNSYLDKLDENFYEIKHPDTVTTPTLLAYNQQLADFLQLDLDSDNQDELAALFSGTSIPDELNPIAMAYAGHQFGNFVPQLGDGRAVLLGEANATDGKSYDVQLKGSGQTRFSRAGDGKSALGPVIREYIVSEAMFNLGVPTTRALAAVATNETVFRQTPEPGGVMTRVASGHVRIGTFEFFAARKMLPQLHQLADYSIDRFYPEANDSENPYLKFFELVSQNIMALVAKWQGLGFIHGVMNTDNMNIAGETIDYGPCAFMDTYQSNKVFSSIDHHGRYAYNQQPAIAQWNLSVLASCLVPLIDQDESKAISLLQGVMNSLQEYFTKQWLAVFRPKLGLFNAEDDDLSLIQAFLENMEKQQLDFTQTFRGLPENIPVELEQRLGRQPQSLDEAKQLMLANNPFIIPRNHQVERAIKEGYEGDFSHFKRLLLAYARPFETLAEFTDLTEAPMPEQMVYQTFCGT